MARRMADCRRFPSESNCSLVIIGDEDEVIRAAAEHAVSVHGHEDTPELRSMIRQGIKETRPINPARGHRSRCQDDLRGRWAHAPTA